MTRPWQTIDTADTPDGRLELRQRGDDDFIIAICGRVLMHSAVNRSELALGRAACEPIARLRAPRVLIGGLGMGFTLRAALDVLPETAQVLVAELNPVVITWCRGVLAGLTGDAVHDPRVRIYVARVESIVGDAEPDSAPRFDAILFDLYEGPHASTPPTDPLYGLPALQRTRSALTPGGVFAVWSEDPDRGFETRLRKAGFRFERSRPGRGQGRHAVYIARANGK